MIKTTFFQSGRLDNAQNGGLVGCQYFSTPLNSSFHILIDSGISSILRKKNDKKIEEEMLVIRVCIETTGLEALVIQWVR